MNGGLPRSERHAYRAGALPARATLLSLAALVGAALVVVTPLFATGEPFGDDLAIHAAEIAHLAESLRDLDAGLWNESANLGFASGYYYQVLPQLVPAAILALAGGALSASTALKASIAIALVLLPLTTFRGLAVAVSVTVMVFASRSTDLTCTVMEPDRMEAVPIPGLAMPPVVPGEP